MLRCHYEHTIEICPSDIYQALCWSNRESTSTVDEISWHDLDAHADSVNRWSCFYDIYRPISDLKSYFVGYFITPTPSHYICTVVPVIRSLHRTATATHSIPSLLSVNFHHRLTQQTGQILLDIIHHCIRSLIHLQPLRQRESLKVLAHHALGDSNNLLSFLGSPHRCRELG